jgi:hypothetical protein
MAMTEITAKKKIGDVDKVATIAYDFGENLKDMVAKFGEEVVFTNARGSFVITAQAAMRRYIETGKPADEIAKIMGSWKPGVALARVVDPVAALTSQWGSFTPEKQAEILRQLKAAGK